MTNRTYVATIDSVERIGMSQFGNPRYRVFFADGSTAETQTDASVNYEIENRTNHGVPLRVEVTPAGRIVGITRISNGD